MTICSISLALVYMDLIWFPRHRFIIELQGIELQLQGFHFT